MRVVGIDQSYTGFGFCIDGESKKRSFTLGRYKGPVERLMAIERWFHDWLVLQSSAGIDLVVMEGYANAAKFGREQAGELGWAVKRNVYLVTGKAPLIVPPTSLKKFVTGSGGGKKSTMLMHVYKQWGVEFSDDNQADAFALEKFGEAYLALVEGRPQPRGSERAYPKYQVEAIEAVRKVQATTD